MNSRPISIVSGLPRCGTSMMMRMLDTGGMPVVIDEIRKADVDNPKGYYEFEQVKQIETDTSWLPACEGKVFKMVSMLLPHLPPQHRYKVIFMRREMQEMLASQTKMLARSGITQTKEKEQQLAGLYTKHLSQVDDWLRQQSNIDVLYVYYNHVMADTGACVNRINSFLGGILDTEAMVRVVDPALYRNIKA